MSQKTTPTKQKKKTKKTTKDENEEAVMGRKLSKRKAKEDLCEPVVIYVLSVHGWWLADSCKHRRGP